MYTKRLGYDELFVYTVEDLARMYVDEGKSKEEALELAQGLYKAMHSMNEREARSWRKARRHETIMPIPEEALC